MGRFDYIKYDEEAQQIQKTFKENMTFLEADIESMLVSPRAKELALTKLEECYMWIGKAIRDDQITLNDGAELQEERSDG